MQRCAWKARVLPGKLAEYKRRHDEIRPEYLHGGHPGDGRQSRDEERSKRKRALLHGDPDWA